MRSLHGRSCSLSKRNGRRTSVDSAKELRLFRAMFMQSRTVPAPSTVSGHADRKCHTQPNDARFRTADVPMQSHLAESVGQYRTLCAPQVSAARCIYENTACKAAQYPAANRFRACRPQMPIRSPMRALSHCRYLMCRLSLHKGSVYRFFKLYGKRRARAAYVGALHHKRHCYVVCHIDIEVRAVSAAPAEGALAQVPA